MESLHFQLFQSFGGLFGFLRYAEKVGEHKTSRIGEQQAAGVDKPLLVCDYGQHQDAAHGLRSGAYVTKGGNERTADTGTQAGVQAVFQAAEANLGTIDILFNNAGVFLDSTFLTATEANLDRTLDVIVKGTFFLTQLVAKHMIEHQIHGRIINTSSSVTKDQAGQPVDYCIAKAGINVLTTALARELGPYGITVNAILPGAIPTKINRWQFADPAIREKFRAGSVLGELGDADYIAGAVKYFISDEARWTTGTLLSVDGGYTL